MRRAIAYAVLAAALLVGSATVPAQAGDPLPADAGVRTADGTLKHGSQKHAFHYRIETNEATWSLELYLIDPSGRQIASSYQAVGADPKVGRDVFRFWSQSTRPGKFTVRARLTWGDYDQSVRWLEPQTFRLRGR
jgi:hypothetical protein